MFTLEELCATPSALASHYRRFDVEHRLLLTGHSHQAWPDRGFEAQQCAWLDAAEAIDEKWEQAFARAQRVRDGYARLLDDRRGDIALAASTHDLVVRFLSALPLRARPRIVTTDGEYHSLRRQLARLAEEGIEVVTVPVEPFSTVTERLADAIDERAAAAMVSAVFFETARILPELVEVQAKCLAVGAELFVDAYHALNVVPFSLPHLGLDAAFVVGGGYKYCQLGEGVAFLRIPPDCRLRPAVTGWFSEFDLIATPDDDSRIPDDDSRIRYGDGPARFAGATYDPTSHYRAAEVLDFFHEHELTPEFLREVSRHQIALLARLFDALDADPTLVTRDRTLPLDRIGGFLALRSPRANDLCRLLRERNIRTDVRGDLLRLGPAPYVTDAQLEAAIGALREVIRDTESHTH